MAAPVESCTVPCTEPASNCANAAEQEKSTKANAHKSGEGKRANLSILTSSGMKLAMRQAGVSGTGPRMERANLPNDMTNCEFLVLRSNYRRIDLIGMLV